MYFDIFYIPAVLLLTIVLSHHHFQNPVSHALWTVMQLRGPKLSLFGISRLSWTRIQNPSHCVWNMLARYKLKFISLCSLLLFFIFLGSKSQIDFCGLPEAEGGMNGEFASTVCFFIRNSLFDFG